MKHLYRIGPRGGVTKIGKGPDNCDMITILGYKPDNSEKLRYVYGEGLNETDRKHDALQSFHLSILSRP